MPAAGSAPATTGGVLERAMQSQHSQEDGGCDVHADGDGDGAVHGGAMGADELLEEEENAMREHSRLRGAGHRRPVERSAAAALGPLREEAVRGIHGQENQERRGGLLVHDGVFGEAGDTGGAVRGDRGGRQDDVGAWQEPSSSAGDGDAAILSMHHHAVHPQVHPLRLQSIEESEGDRGGDLAPAALPPMQDGRRLHGMQNRPTRPHSAQPRRHRDSSMQMSSSALHPAGELGSPPDSMDSDRDHDRDRDPASRPARTRPQSA